jgi:hypothetical protein
MKNMLRTAVAAVALVSGGAAIAQSFDAAAAFGARETVEGAALSPDGRRIAYLSPREGQGSRLFVADVGSQQPRAVTSVDGRGQRLHRCDWVSNARLVCTIYAVTQLGTELVVANRLIALNADGTNVRNLGQRDSGDQVAARLYGGRVLDWLPGTQDEILMEQLFIPEGRAWCGSTPSPG